ncbi:MAG TPA: AbrB/MazE/SpoVT family DNA-binding domain-containing protein [Verrucomicrobiae bacterium]|jgi:bifunctional DNA-binding transcriptional regulator/antitoxin component of YhaV-PrlF toxin-antitoxin module|nr:AbrB/MazE/SpoVT family DNA-binding domain-containing protein [Verrucomicrobiae bacterium]
MSATIVREKRQTTLPADVVEAAGLRVNDQVDWRFEGGEIRGRKLEPAGSETLEEWPKVRGKVSRVSIRESIKAGRR